jgi:hypothetical protein
MRSRTFAARTLVAALVVSSLFAASTHAIADPVCNDPVPDCPDFYAAPGDPQADCLPTNPVFTLTFYTPGDPISDELKWRFPAHEWTIKRSTSPINASNWASATVVRTRLPLAPGLVDTCTFVGVHGVTYYFAIRSTGYSNQLSDVCSLGSASCPGFGGGGLVARPGTEALTLQAVGPNPTRSTCRLSLSLPASSGHSARLGVFDLAGRRVRSLSLAGLGAGPQLVEWDLRSDSGDRVRSGMYFIRLSVAGEQRSAVVHIAE